MFQPLQPIPTPADGERLSLKVNSDLNALDTVLEYFEQLERPWIPRKDWLESQLALAEGFTNAVRHAHRGLPPEIPIEIEIRLYPEMMEIRIWDRGEPFDLDGFLEKLSQKEQKLAVHGQGLPILRKIASRLSYWRSEDGRNCLLIVKKFMLKVEGAS